MLSFICGLAAIGNACINGMTIKMATEIESYQELEKNPEIKKRDAVFSYVDAYPVRKKSKWRKTNISSKYNKEESGTETKDEIAEWCSSHMDLLIQITNPGKHFISKEEYKGVDVELLKNSLFETMDIESIDETEDGIYILTR